MSLNDYSYNKFGGEMTKKVFSIRLTAEAIVKITKIALRKHLPIRTMVQSWIMERVDEEW